MARKTEAYRRLLQAAGGLGLGLYFTAGLVYFQTFSIPEAPGWIFFLPIWGIFALLGTAFFVLSQRPSASATKRDFSLLKIAFPVLLIALAGSLTWLYAGFTRGHTLDLAGIVFGHAGLLGLLPLAAYLLILQSRMSQLPEDFFELPNSTTDAPHFKVGVGQSGKAFEIPRSALVLIEAADNYCKVHYLEDGDLKMELLRVKMKEAEEALDNASTFFRCHRSYLVNATAVRSISGNSQAYKLELDHGLEPVRVSRSFDLSPLRKLLQSRP